jgi:curved DNA-binding protein CbpA
VATAGWSPEQRKDNVKTEQSFVDHYEVLQVSQNADGETVERVYRLLAKRYHPDNTSSGDEDRFREVREAFEVLSDPERRARFDIRYDDQNGSRWRIFAQDEALNDHQRDQRIFHGVLSLLYAARRRNPQAGGLGAMHLEETLGVPREHLEFPMWYLRKRGLVETLDSGIYAITIEGIDWLGHDDRALPDNRLLARSTVEAPSQNGAHADQAATSAP